MPQDQLDTWVLFCRAVLGLDPGDSLELADPFGLIRSSGVANAERSVRFVLNVSLQPAHAHRAHRGASGGSGVHHIAFDCADIFATVERLRGARRALRADLAQLLRRPDHPVRHRPGDRRAHAERWACSSTGGRTATIFHIYTETFADRFFFEIVQRTAYDAYGALNAPARMAAQEQNAAMEALKVRA